MDMQSATQKQPPKRGPLIKAACFIAHSLYTLHHQSAITSLQLHWLKVPWQIDYKLAVLVLKCLHGLAPSHLADEIHLPAELEQHITSAPSLPVFCSRLKTYFFELCYL